MKKWMYVVVAVAVLAGGIFWARSNNDDSVPNGEEIIATDIPVPLKKDAPAPELADYSSEFGTVKTKYPKGSVVEKGADNSEEFQIVTIESPQDQNTFYFCTSLDEYAAGNDQDLSVPLVEVTKVESFPVSGVGKSLYLVTYKNNRENASENDYQWALTENQPQVGDIKFVGEITSQQGRRVQILGKFNCREESRPNIELEDFNNSQLQTEARQILTNLLF